jgi:hypothetical protein
MRVWNRRNSVRSKLTKRRFLRLRTKDAGHGVGDVDAVVVGEPPGALDGALGGRWAGLLAADGGEIGALSVDSGGDEHG